MCVCAAILKTAIDSRKMKENEMGMATFSNVWGCLKYKALQILMPGLTAYIRFCYHFNESTFTQELTLGGARIPISWVSACVDGR